MVGPPRDWFCHPFQPRRESLSLGLCWPTLDICNHERNDLRRRKHGKVGACAPQRVAHCVQVGAEFLMSRHHLCAASHDDCQAVRAQSLKKLTYHYITECQPMLNRDAYDQPRDFAWQRLDE